VALLLNTDAVDGENHPKMDEKKPGL